MIEKISNIKLNKKWIIILSSVLCVVLVGILLFVFLGKRNGDKNYGENNSNSNNNSASSNTSSIIDRTKQLSGYANDTAKVIKENIYQPFEESDVVLNVYGEVGYNNLEGTIFESVPMDTACSDEDVENWKLGNKNNEVLLNDEPTKVKNHCIIKLSRSSDVSSIVSDESAYVVSNYGPYILSAYIELPDGSLITFSSGNSKSIQVNIYEKEIRVILEGGSAYFRIVKQEEGKIFTVQVGDKIFQTTGGTELFAYSSINNTYGTGFNEFYEKNKEEVEFYKELEGYDDFYGYLMNDYFAYHTASFQVVKCSGDIFTRGSNSKFEKDDGEYRFVYYPNYSVDGDKEGGYLVTSANDQRFNSFGAYATEADEIDSHKEFYQFLENQRALNKLNYGFSNIIVEKIDIDTAMKGYLAQFTSIAKQRLIDYNANKPIDDSTCSYSWFLSMLDNCGCQDGWYHIAHVGCCPNGYTYSATKNQCIRTIIVKGSCPSGTYDVGNDKCCPNGTTISSNGLSCVHSSSGKKTPPTYYPDSNNNATKEPAPNIDSNIDEGGCSPQTICDAKDANGCSFYGMYEKNGQCCMDLVCVE
ncbi:MAG TPA: hypothetical protein PLL26_00755 [Candidatus Dojkabacteria bacterium]|nr:hypothetical protein [Candidatus Dojkabacteria bacterium]